MFKLGFLQNPLVKTVNFVWAASRSWAAGKRKTALLCVDVPEGLWKAACFEQFVLNDRCLLGRAQCCSAVKPKPSCLPGSLVSLSQRCRCCSVPCSAMGQCRASTWQSHFPCCNGAVLCDWEWSHQSTLTDSCWCSAEGNRNVLWKRNMCSLLWW